MEHTTTILLDECIHSLKTNEIKAQELADTLAHIGFKIIYVGSQAVSISATAEFYQKNLNFSPSLWTDKIGTLLPIKNELISHLSNFIQLPVDMEYLTRVLNQIQDNYDFNILVPQLKSQGLSETETIIIVQEVANLDYSDAAHIVHNTQAYDIADKDLNLFIDEQKQEL